MLGLTLIDCFGNGQESCRVRLLTHHVIKYAQDIVLPKGLIKVYILKVHWQTAPYEKII